MSSEPAVSDPVPPKQHRMVIDVEQERWLSFRVVCPHDPAETDRPCWPYETEVDDPQPLPAPQGCNYAEWVDNLGAECIGGSVTFECGFDVEWYDWPTFNLRALSVEGPR